jgi:hypothetical protein
VKRLILQGLYGLILLLLAGCEQDIQNPVERLGLQETTLGRALVEEAVNAANAVIGQHHPYRFARSWQTTSVEQSGTTIRIYLPAPDGVSAVYNVMVPTNCQCVFVQSSAFHTWVERYSTALPQMLAVEPRDVLVLMLLHELGHIAHGDPGQFETESERVTLNLDQTFQKMREENADRFAVEEVAAASRDMQAMQGWLRALSIQMALTNLSWNLNAARMLDHFGGSTLCSRFLFADTGYSHPNLELRILTMNALLFETPTSQQLLESFKGCRSRGESTVIFDSRAPQ